MGVSASSTLLVPILLGTGSASFIVLGWLLRAPRLALGVLLCSVLVGQAWRFPLPGQGGGVLLSDVAASGVLLVASGQWLWRRQRQLAGVGAWWWLWWLIPFIVWSLFSLVVNMPTLPAGGSTVALAYWLRLTVLLLLGPALWWLLKSGALPAGSARRGLLVLIVGLVVLGAGQLWLMPNLTGGGWDPHQARLVATWLDPNFFGAFLLLSLLWTIAEAHARWSFPIQRWLLSGLGASITLELIGTQSRSTLVTLGVVGLCAGLLIVPYSRIRRASTALLGTSLVLLLILVASSLAIVTLGERLRGLVTYDATVELRASALGSVLQLAADNAWLGVGYNAYQYTAQSSGLISDFTIHSRAGADSSLLTLWVTTGIFGVCLFALPWLRLFRQLLTRWLRERHGLSLAAALAMGGLALHAQFVNSFLYSHLLIVLTVMVVAALHDSVAKLRHD